MPATFKGKSRRQSSNRGGRRGGAARAQNPSSLTLSYNGPIEQPQAQQQPIVRLLSFAGAVASDATGAIKFVLGPGPVTSPDWSALAGLYAEYRVLGATFRWVPYFTGYSTSSTPLASSFVVLGLVRASSAAAFGSVALALSCIPRKVGPMGRAMRLDYKMNGAIEAGWINTASGGGNPCVFTLNSNGLTASSTYGNYVVETLVQFRNPF